MRHGYAILDGRQVKECTFDVWRAYIAKNLERQIVYIGLDIVCGCRVSTVFLGIDHGWDDAPLWFETMIFGGAKDDFQTRYTTYDEAEAGHQVAIEMVKQSEGN